MRVRVIQCFACGPRVYKPGVYDLTPELADDMDQLLKLGWIVIVKDIGDPIHLHKPEDGLSLALR